MYSGEINSADVLLNRGLNGNYAGFGAVGFTPFAGDGSAVNANVRGNRDISLLESVNRTGMDAQLSNTIVRGNEFLTDRINQQFTADRFNTLERLLFNQQTAVQQQLFSIQNKQTECCCETLAGIAQLNAKVDGLQALNAKDAEITRLQTELLVCRTVGNGGPGQGN